MVRKNIKDNAISGSDQTPKQIIPSMEGGFNSIIESIFDNSDLEVGKEYDDIVESFEIKDALDNIGLKTAANKSEKIAFRASRLWVVACVEYKAYIRETDIIINSLKDEAKKTLEEMKINRLITKQITENDVVSKAIQLYSDEWNGVQKKRDEADGMLKHLETMVKIARSRAHTLSNMINPTSKIRL